MGTCAEFDPNTSDLEQPSIVAQVQVAVRNINNEAIEELKGANEHVKFVESLRMLMGRFFDFKSEYYATRIQSIRDITFCNDKTYRVDIIQATLRVSAKMSMSSLIVLSLKVCTGDPSEARRF